MSCFDLCWRWGTATLPLFGGGGSSQSLLSFLLHLVVVVIFVSIRFLIIARIFVSLGFSLLSTSLSTLGLIIVNIFVIIMTFIIVNIHVAKKVPILPGLSFPSKSLNNKYFSQNWNHSKMGKRPSQRWYWTPPYHSNCAFVTSILDHIASPHVVNRSRAAQKDWRARKILLCNIFNQFLTTTFDLVLTLEAVPFGKRSRWFRTPLVGAWLGYN